MPELDNTGPLGEGPTGRGAGSCPNKRKNFTRMPGRGRGRVCGRGMAQAVGGRHGSKGRGQCGGRGRSHVHSHSHSHSHGDSGCGCGCGDGHHHRHHGEGRHVHVHLSKQDEKLFLEKEIKLMEDQINAMKKRLSELEVN